jgi:hypothetical protein
MEPYIVHLDDWSVAMYSTDDGRLTFTITNNEDNGDRLTHILGEVRLRRHYLGSVCAGELYPTPFDASLQGSYVSTKNTGKYEE